MAALSTMRRLLAFAAVLLAWITNSYAAPAASPDKALVYIYRYKQFTGSAVEPSVYCDESQLARMDNGRYFLIALAPGRHQFRSNDPQSGLEVDAKAGQAYYLRVDIVNVRFFKGAQGRLVKTDPEQGAYELKQLKPLDVGKIKDRTLVVSQQSPETDRTPVRSDVLLNQDVIDLKAAGLSDDTIIAKIRGSMTKFSTTTQDLIELKKANLSDAVIQAMIEAHR
jgi:hypothetical protein